MSQAMQTYEAMFLVDAGNPDFRAASEPARVALERNEAEILALNPWDERRLAYEIKGRRRGLYILAYFKAPPGRITEIERDCRLDERILRALVLRRDHLSEQEIRAETPAMASSRRAAQRRAEQAAAAAGESSPPEAPAKAPADGTPAPAEDAAAKDAPAGETASTGPAPAEAAEGAQAGETPPAGEAGESAGADDSSDNPPDVPGQAGASA